VVSYRCLRVYHVLTVVNNHMRKTSTRDIANAIGLSHATVSYVLSGRKDKGISEQTMRRVMDVAKQLNYRQNRVAPSVFRGYTQVLGVLMPDSDSTFFARILGGVQKACHECDFVVHLTYTERDPDIEAKDVNRMLEHRVAGVLVVETGLSRSMPHPWLSSLVAEGIPCVIVDDADACDVVGCVVSDDFEGARLIVNHLLSHGHRRIAFLTGVSVTSCVRERRVGFEAAMKGAGCDTEGLISCFEYSEQNVFSAVANMLANNNPPTAIFADTDYAAEVVMNVLYKMNLRVPHDIAVVGYADTELSRGLRLTTVHQDAHTMGYIAAKRLLVQAGGELLPNEIVRIPSSLVVRRTCGCSDIIA